MPPQTHGAARSAPTEVQADTLSALLTQAGLALVVVTALAAVLGWLVAGRVLRPIRAISATARRLSAENLPNGSRSRSPPTNCPRWPARQRMLDRIQHGVADATGSCDSQRLFIANAATNYARR